MGKHLASHIKKYQIEYIAHAHYYAMYQGSPSNISHDWLISVLRKG